MKRTHLPLNGLRVLDAAARHLSFTRAADELAVTPAAVGQQVRALEDTLGTVLFRRTAKGLELTPEGEAGLAALRRGFLEFEDAVRAMQEGQSSRHLAIAAPRDLTAKWLGGKLAGFRSAHPDVRIRLVAADGLVDFTEANLDLAIVHAERIDGHEALALDPAGLVTVARDGGDTEDIHWGQGVEGAGLTVADAGLAIDAVAAGLGRATVPALLAAGDIAAGRVTQQGAGIPGAGRYWLVAPLPQWRQKKVRALVAALAGTAPGGGVPEMAG